MYNEFGTEDVEFEGPFKTGKEVLAAFEIEDVDRTRDMIVLVVYVIVLHLISFAVLVIKYDFLKGSIESPKKNQ